MAKQPPSKGGTARIRFIMLEAELPEGDLTQITSAIQNALKPSTVVQQRLPTQLTAPALVGNGRTLGEQEIIESDPTEVDEEQVTDAPTAKRDVRTRKPTVPKVIELDLKSGVSLEDYLDEHSPNSEPERHLVIGAYFKEHRSDNTITVNHVFTCYKALRWSTSIDDFAWPLRHLKREQLMTNPERGQYAINGLGLDRVHKMGPKSA